MATMRVTRLVTEEVEAALLPIPWKPNPAYDRENGGRGDRGMTRCLLCARPLPRTGGIAYEVHEVEGGGVLLPIDVAYDDEAADIGWWQVGPECAKSLPRGYVAVYDPKKADRPAPLTLVELVNVAVDDAKDAAEASGRPLEAWDLWTALAGRGLTIARKP